MDSAKATARSVQRGRWLRFSLLRLVLVVFVLVIGWIGVAFGLAVYRDSRSQGILGAADYPAVREAMLSRMQHMPATLPAGARFCNECGTSVAAGAAPRGAEAAAGAPTQDNAVAKYLPWGLAAVLLVAVSAYFINGASTAPAVADAGAAPFAPFANGGGGAAPDIANMSPRERASRLYDRIMRYTEQGKADSAQFFAPMALASFDMLGAGLDTDARYDYGRVAAVTGNLVIAAAQADTILQAAPTHLLGLSLRARTATARGDAATAATAWKSFLASRDGELKKDLPEYQMHAADIEQSVALAAAK